MAVRVIDEKSRSKSGLHHRRILFMVLTQECRNVDYEVIEVKSLKPTYAKGYAKELKIKVPNYAFVIQLDFRKNIKGHVLGDVYIYDYEGNLLGKAVYRKLKVRLVRYVSKELIELIKCIFRLLKLPVKRYAILQLH